MTRLMLPIAALAVLALYSPRLPAQTDKSKHDAAVQKTRQLGGEVQTIHRLFQTFYQVNLKKPAIKDADLDYLKDIQDLAVLDLTGSSVTDEGLKRLGSLTALEGLILAQTKITDKGLPHLKRLPKLAGVNLSDTAVTDEGMKTLAEMGDLIAVNVAGSKRQISDAGLKRLAALTKLQYLLVTGRDLSDAGLAHLKPLRRLETLFLSGPIIDGRLRSCGITDAGLETLSAMPRLTNFTLQGGKVTGRGLVHLKKLERLTTLCLVDGPLADKDLAPLADLVHLRTLKLVGSSPTAAGTQRIALTDAALAHVKGLKRLQTLHLSYSDVSDEGLKQLQELSELQSLSLAGTRVTDAGLKHLERLKKLQSLSVMDTKVAAAGVRALRAALPKPIVVQPDACGETARECNWLAPGRCRPGAHQGDDSPQGATAGRPNADRCRPRPLRASHRSAAAAHRRRRPNRGRPGTPRHIEEFGGVGVVPLQGRQWRRPGRDQASVSPAKAGNQRVRNSQTLCNNPPQKIARPPLSGLLQCD
jgi:internalin A